MALAMLGNMNYGEFPAAGQVVKELPLRVVGLNSRTVVAPLKYPGTK